MYKVLRLIETYHAIQSLLCNCQDAVAAVQEEIDCKQTIFHFKIMEQAHVYLRSDIHHFLWKHC